MTEAQRGRSPTSVEYGELPELTRTLRALGSSRQSSADAAVQSQFFDALLQARKRAAEAKTPAQRIAAFDTTALLRALERTIERVVSDWPDNRAPVRRALRAELFARVEPYIIALDDLRAYAAPAIDADDEERLHTWRQWTSQLARVFETADRSWIALRSAIPQRANKP